MASYENEISVSKYNPEQRKLWDEFVSSSKNGVFLFYRDFMEYHSDRFKDHSLLFFKKGHLVGLLPANVKDNILCSHGGLTFGGVISSYDVTISTALMLEIFGQLILHCKHEGIREILYEPVPFIYHSVPADEDLYALFRHNADLIGRSVSSCIPISGKLPFIRNRNRNIQKAKENNLFVKRSFDFKSCMKIFAEALMKRHEAKPAHTGEEIELLANRFPDNIKLFGSYKNDTMLGGVIVFESKNVAHAQYGANSEEGRELGAEDLAFDYLINDYYKNKKYFDFGISTEKSGRILNEGLIRYKAGFGACPTMYDLYKLQV